MKNIFLFVSIALLFTSCVGIFASKESEVRVKTRAYDAKVFNEKDSLGKTPVTIKLDKGRANVIRLEKDGYLTYYDCIFTDKTKLIGIFDILNLGLFYNKDRKNGSASKFNKTIIDAEM